MRLRALTERSLGLAAGAAVVVAALPSAYLFATSATGLLAGATGRRRTDHPGLTGDEADGRHRFVVLIPAHNEAENIAETVSALSAQRYPAACFQVHVVADNCTDATADIAEQHGAVAHRRTEPEDPGKGPALNWLYDRLVDDDVPFDVVVYIDADTVAAPGFLAAMDVAFADGASAAQGYYGVRNPDASPSIGLRYAAIAGRHHLRPYARRRWGSTCGLFGNGMAFRREITNERRWSGHLTEDAEYQLDLLTDGRTVRYVDDAAVHAEMPDTLDAATTQNERWELGRAQLTKRYLGSMCSLLVRGGPLRRKVYADSIADLLLPAMSGVAALDIIALATSSGAVVARRDRRAASTFVVATVCCATLAVHVAMALRAVSAPPSVWASLRSAPRLIVWKLGLLLRVSSNPDDVDWMRTTRNSERSEVES